MPLTDKEKVQIGGGLGGGVGGLVGSLAILGGAAGSGGKKDYERIAQLAQEIQLPDFDFSKLSPPELQMVAELFPEVYEVHVPDEVKTIIEQPEGRQAQLDAMDYFRDFGGGDLPLAERLAAERAGRGVQEATRGAQMSALENFQRRGVKSGGELGAALGQERTNLAADLGVGLQESAIRARQNAMQSLAGVGGQMRGQDINVAGQNADMINRFNRAVSDDYNQAAQYAADERARAQGYNVGTQQRVADTNVMENYANRQYNFGREDTLKQQGFENEVTKQAAVERALKALAGYKDAEQVAKSNAIMGAGKGGGQSAGGFGGLLF